jgi:hypothetical protein
MLSGLRFSEGLGAWCAQPCELQTAGYCWEYGTTAKTCTTNWRNVLTATASCCG